MVNIYVGNLARELTEQALQQAFEAYGKVDRVSIITDRDTGRSRGFGFVEMANENEAQAAISALNGKELAGRPLTVNVSKPKAGGAAPTGRSARRDW